MRIIELTIEQFDVFATNHPLRNYCQNSKYAKLMGETGYNYDYIGYYDDSNTLIAASLILHKKIGNLKRFAYAPKGFLIDYYNQELLKMFINDIVEYYKKKDFVFIKINPEIIIGNLNIKKNFAPNYNQNVKIIDDLKDLGFKRRREVKPLDLMMPRLSPYINLKEYSLNKIAKTCKDKIADSEKKGLIFEQVTNREVGILYEFVKDNTYQNINYFRNLLNVYTDTGEIYLIKVDYEQCLINTREKYDLELEHNNDCNQKIQENNTEELLNEKMQSDKDLLNLKNEIIAATEGLKNNKYKYIGGVIIVKYINRVSIIIDGYDDNFSDLYPYEFMINILIKKYQADYDFLDMNGLAGDYSDTGVYSKFNNQKIEFNPTVYEFIGEFDIILNDYAFKRAQSKNILLKDFIPSHKFK